ncbi:MAG: hypothetical protein A2945_01235 [Candidatus Liptonbacteria bacterium RIFCSPLOWO2_01_FULL_52_25]|uniref:DUF1648 domain-containing protein n=1 Tax=Candidatus Liptonbacteria bacterium RIFCSPLOWO2_01_FULL_52_25 TaxID=1798650 RepID=A0A1G2CDJ9_9BACT|nr:MAG: hypothetical protein A2945_01235 [Candidatus Liptonbacteria bacterium RIFCSPLOWO2_01_FULL_52_25]
MVKRFAKFRFLGVTFLASFLLIVGGCLWAYLKLKGATSPLILHFNDAGINQIGSFKELLWIGITGMVAVVVNFFVALEFEARDRFLGKMLAAGTLLLGVLLFIGFAAIISVN